MEEVQAKMIADCLVSHFYKEGADLPQDAVQTVLDKEMEPMIEEMYKEFRRRVDAKLALAPRDTFTVSLSERHEPSLYYVERPGSKGKPGLSLFDSFKSFVRRAKPTEIGTTFRVSSVDVMRPLNELEIEAGLDDYLFDDEGQVCAVIAHLITHEPQKLLLNPADNLFFTSSCVVQVSWACTSDLWHIHAGSERDERRKVIDVVDRVFCLRKKPRTTLL